MLTARAQPTRATGTRLSDGMSCPDVNVHAESINIGLGTWQQSHSSPLPARRGFHSLPIATEAHGSAQEDWGMCESGTRRGIRGPQLRGCG